MKTFSVTRASLILLSISEVCHSFSTNTLAQIKTQTGTELSMQKQDEQQYDRRSMFKTCGAALLFGAELLPKEANAKPDCMTDCLKNCKLIAPKDTGYCLDNCKSYCAQEDRTDGLSGSVSSEGGEMGILGTSTVVKGEDKPPKIALPGLDFSSEKGRKLLGY